MNTSTLETDAEPGPANWSQKAGQRYDERGEGVISTAIAVLIVALLGVALWAGFRIIVDDATTRTGEQIQQIDGASPGAP